MRLVRQRTVFGLGSTWKFLTLQHVIKECVMVGTCLSQPITFLLNEFSCRVWNQAYDHFTQERSNLKMMHTFCQVYYRERAAVLNQAGLKRGSKLYATGKTTSNQVSDTLVRLTW